LGDSALYRKTKLEREGERLPHSQSTNNKKPKLDRENHHGGQERFLWLTLMTAIDSLFGKRGGIGIEKRGQKFQKKWLG